MVEWRIFGWGGGLVCIIFAVGMIVNLFHRGGSCRISAVVLPVFHLSELINTKLRPLIIEYITRVVKQLNAK